MLVTLQDIIEKAEQGNYCVPAFNVYNIETVMGVIDAAEELNAPVIMQLYPRLVNEQVGYYIAPVVLAAAQKAKVPVCLHLDHAAATEVYKSLRWGFTGIMQDGSSLPFDENVALTRSAVEMCSVLGVGVEGEIGHVGSAFAEGTKSAVNDPNHHLAVDVFMKGAIAAVKELAGGLGVGSREGFARLEAMARRIGAAPAASRAAVDAGFAPYRCQVGITGATVCPRLYIAVGISGAVLHLAGMSGSATVIAINSDPKAPIFDYADYGFVGHWETVMQELEVLL